MRKLFIMRGCPGSGKSTLIRRLGMERCALGLDQVRALFSGDYGTTDGDTSLALRNQKEIAQVTYDALSHRLDAGDLIFWDATVLDQRDVTRLVGMGVTYGYQCFLVEMQHGLSWEEIRERNSGRGADKLEEQALRAMYERGLAQLDPQGARVIEGPEAEAVISQLLREGDVAQSFDAYDRVVVVGDVQSCADALGQAIEEFGPLDDPRTAWVFIGDLFDRGPDAGGVFAALSPERENVYLVEGNHDTNMRRVVYETARRLRSYPETRASLEQIEAAGFAKKDVKALLARMVPWLYFTFRGQDYIATHGGVDFSHEGDGARSSSGEGTGIAPSRHAVREYIYGTSGRQLTYVGQTDYGIDTGDFANPAVIQFHGHRNGDGDIEPRGFTRDGQVYVLEAKVEHGGQLRVAVIHNDATISTHEYTDREVARQMAAEESESVKDPLVAKLRQSPWVRAVEIGNGITAYNFTREAFSKGKWDESTIAARGLFMRGDEVVARGYEKFFEVGDYSGHGFSKADVLGGVFEYPCRLSRKENGFLALVASVDGKLRVFSKSGFTDYSQAAEELLRTKLAGREDELARKLAQAGVTLACEVILAADPHIIRYEQERIVVLDAIKNSTEFAVEDSIAQGVCAEFGLERAAHTMIADPSEFDVAKLAQMPGEGFVLRDRAGRMVKVKTQYYRRGKGLRAALARVVAGKARALPGKFADEERALRALEIWGNWDDYMVQGIGDRQILNLPVIWAAVADYLSETAGDGSPTPIANARDLIDKGLWGW